MKCKVRSLAGSSRSESRGQALQRKGNVGEMTVGDVTRCVSAFSFDFISKIW